MAKARNTDKDRGLAEFLYTEGRMKQREIAEYLGYSENTISAWAADGNWKDLKNALSITPGRLVAALLKQSNDILEVAEHEGRPINSKEMDTISKITAAIERLNRKVTPSVTMAVLDDFNQFGKTIDVKAIQGVIHIQREYIKQKIQGSDGKG